MSENPLIPMGAITGRPTREFIRQRLSEFRDVGITQYLIYPRSGCEITYMSEEWFNTCQAILEEAKALNFTSIWLYDEFNWPSGQCGGKVQQTNPDYCLKRICWLPDNEDPYYESDPRYPNLLNPKAVEFFIANTHELYAQHFGKYFGNLIKGIFTDEPAFGYHCGYKDNIIKLAFYPEIDLEYQKETGKPLSLPPKRHDNGEVNADTIDYDTYYRLVYRRFRTCFFDPIRSWCDRHNLLLTGHLMNEYEPESAKIMSGDPLAVIKCLSLPGIDEISTKITPDTIEWVTLGTGRYGIEVNRQNSRRKLKSGGLAELFALGPADISLGKMRQMISLTALFSIDHYVLAVSQLDFRGNVGKPNWFNPYSADRPDWPYFKLLGDAAKSAAALAQKTAAAEIAVRYPDAHAHAMLLPLLVKLSQRQLPWKLINTNDRPDVKSMREIISLSAAGVSLELTGQQAENIDVAVELLEASLGRDFSVVATDGSLATELCTRLYADGTIAILDLTDTDKERQLYLHYQQSIIPFVLHGRELLTFPGWKITRDRLNLAVPVWNDNCYQFIVQDAAISCYIICRNWHETAAVELDGQTILADQLVTCGAREQTSSQTGEQVSNETILSPGFQELYRKSALIKLAVGEHQLKLVQGTDEFCFLPAVWLAGDFAFTRPDIFTPDYQNGQGLDCYAGQIIQTGQLNIPADASAFQLDCDELATEIFLDQTSIGIRAWAPFIWTIPISCRGKSCEWKIVRATSVEPMFDRNNHKLGVTPAPEKLHFVTIPKFIHIRS